MKRLPRPALCLLLVLLPATAPARDEGGRQADAVVHVNAIREPEAHGYRAIVAGMARFDERHALAPAAPQLLFRVAPHRSGEALPSDIAVKLAGDSFSLPLALDGEGRFAVPRLQAAWDEKAELAIDRKKRSYAIRPYVRTPGLAPDVLRLGDLRLECQVSMAIAREELGTMWSLTLTALARSTDWCSVVKQNGGGYVVYPPARVARAVLREGERRQDLRASDRGMLVPVGDAGWSDEALVELEFAAAPDAATTRTAGETPRTGP